MTACKRRARRRVRGHRPHKCGSGLLVMQGIQPQRLVGMSDGNLAIVRRKSQVAAIVGELELEELIGCIALPEIEPAAATAAGQADPKAVRMMGDPPSGSVDFFF